MDEDCVTAITLSAQIVTQVLRCEKEARSPNLRGPLRGSKVVHPESLKSQPLMWLAAPAVKKQPQIRMTDAVLRCAVTVVLLYLGSRLRAMESSMPLRKLIDSGAE